MKRFTLIGLCEPPSPEQLAAFNDWFIDQHIEDTVRCPIFISGRVLKLTGDHIDIDTPSDYLSIYEIEAESQEEAERVLNEWQANPDAWEGRKLHNDTREKYGEMPLKILGSGWYEPIAEYTGPAAKK